MRSSPLKKVYPIGCCMTITPSGAPFSTERSRPRLRYWPIWMTKKLRPMWRLSSSALSFWAFASLKRQPAPLNYQFRASVTAVLPKELCRLRSTLYRAGGRPLFDGLGGNEPFASRTKNSEIGIERAAKPIQDINGWVLSSFGAKKPMQSLASRAATSLWLTSTVTQRVPRRRLCRYGSVRCSKNRNRSEGWP